MPSKKTKKRTTTIKDWRITVTRHHNVEVPDYHILVQADDLQGAMAQGFECVLQELFCDAPDNLLDLIKDAVARIAKPAPVKQHGGSSERFAQLLIKDDEGLFLLWHDSPDKGSDEPNIGIGPGSGGPAPQLTDKYENRWLSIKEWDGNPARRAELAALDKDQLIDLLTRHEAVN